MLIFYLFFLALTIYLVWWLEKMKKRFKPRNSLVKYFSLVVEAQMVITALIPLFEWMIWVQAITGLSVSAYALILINQKPKDCPMGLVCSQMGLFGGSVCENFRVCRRNNG